MTNYYSNAAHSALIGQKIEDCGGMVHVWETSAGYVTFSEQSC